MKTQERKALVFLLTFWATASTSFPKLSNVGKTNIFQSTEEEKSFVADHFDVFQTGWEVPLSFPSPPFPRFAFPPAANTCQNIKQRHTHTLFERGKTNLQK